MIDNSIYSALAGVQDPVIRNILRLIADSLAQMGNSVQSGGASKSKTLTIGDIKTQLQAGGGAPLVLTGLPGGSNQAIIGTHAQRLLTPAISQTKGTQFIETDRNYTYTVEPVSGVNTWVWTSGGSVGLVASLWTGLGTNDAGAIFYGSDNYTQYEWDGTQWVTVGGALWKATFNSLTAAQWQNVAGTTILDIDSTNKRVGIGTTAPTVQLEVKADPGNNPQVMAHDTSTTGNGGSGFALYNDYNNAGSRNWGISQGTVAYGDLSIRVSNAAAGNPFSAGSDRLYMIGTGTMTLPQATDTLIGKATTDVLTNKTFDTAGAGNVLKVAGTSVTALSGSGNTLATNNLPVLTAPFLGTPTSGDLANCTNLPAASVVAGSLGSGDFAVTGNFAATATLKVGLYTVATLPAGSQGMLAGATDLLAPAFLVAAVGGGAVKGLVYHNGTTWVAV